MGDPNVFATTLQGLPCHVVVDRWVEGLAGGGLRFHPEVTPAELQQLARTMTHKWALLGLPIGGCKLGVRGDPRRVEKKRVLEAFAREAADFLRDRIITGPDMGTTAKDMGAFFRSAGQDGYDAAAQRLSSLGYRPSSWDAYRRIMRTLQSDITGVAAAHAAVTGWEAMGRVLEGATVSIQGFGSVGRAMAVELRRLGARIVALADAEGCLVRTKGLDPRDLPSTEAGLLPRDRLPPGTQRRPREAWLDVGAEILVPAAVAGAIQSEDVPRLQTEMVVEAANLPVTPEVEGQLHANGVLVLPDFVVNGGLAATFGVLVTSTWKDAQRVREEVLHRIVEATERVAERAVRQGRVPREVAMELAEKAREA